MATIEDWKPLGGLAPDTLLDARLQLHWAAQIASSAGKTYLEPRPDDSHPNLGWNADQTALAGHLTPSPHRFQAALRLADLTLLLLDEKGKVLAEKPLDGCTLEEGRRWLEQAIRTSTGASKPLLQTGYDLPSHPVSRGEPFQLGPPRAFEELSRWYANAALALDAVETKYSQASPVRCWPHHFDIATLIALDPDKDAESARSVGAGMTPGDDSIPEPYWYVNLWPYPEDVSKLPLQGGGCWHTEGWTGAVLQASRMALKSGAAEQARQVEDFLRSAIEGSLKSLGWNQD